jgi:predicted transcriptional regulator
MPLAIRRSNDLGLSPNDIKNYFARAQHVGMYEIETIELASVPLTLERIRRDLVFYPPQSFFFLSEVGKDFIDSQAHFRCSAKTARTK